MKNITGKAVVSEDYLKTRLYLVDELRELIRRTSVVIEAPRRFGKTSVIKEFKRQEFEKPERDREFNILFLELEGEETLNEFCFKLFRELLLLYHLRRQFDRVKVFLGDAWNTIASRIGKVQIPEFELELREKTRDMDFTKWKEKLTPLINGLNSFDRHTVIAFDEFPDMLLNFKNRERDPKDFITLVDNLTAWLRALRQKEEDGCRYQFIFCGSVNLRKTLEGIGLSKRMNDIEAFIVPQMKAVEARLLINTLMANKDDAVEIDSDGIDFMVSKITNGSPYYGQILFKALKDTREKKINCDKLKTIYDDMLRCGNHDLNHFHSRLETYLSPLERECSKTILKHLCSEAFHEKQLFEAHLAGSCSYENFRSVVNRLIYEGYITRDIMNDGKLEFVAPLLRDWWSFKVGVK